MLPTICIQCGGPIADALCLMRDNPNTCAACEQARLEWDEPSDYSRGFAREALSRHGQGRRRKPEWAPRLAA